ALVLLASSAGIRTVIHEHNDVPGRANAFLERIVTSVAVTFDETRGFLMNRAVTVTGNPLREDIARLAQSSGRATGTVTTVLVIGGSQGARSLNRVVAEALIALEQDMPGRLRIVHIAGPIDAESVRDRYASSGIRATTYTFVDKIQELYAMADLAVTRSGAAAIFELALYGKPMIMIPYPNKRNSQYKNARYFADKGAALYFDEKEMDASLLKKLIGQLIADRALQARLTANARKLSRPDAASLLARVVQSAGS
ncbi:MAG: glycosyltransferase, partial [Candidatus Omnitrophica bacterium]|nr:glycosyltransferase [Candidatus Omnitrophota bacterium]